MRTFSVLLAAAGFVAAFALGWPAPSSERSGSESGPPAAGLRDLSLTPTAHAAARFAPAWERVERPALDRRGPRPLAVIEGLLLEPDSLPLPILAAFHPGKSPTPFFPLGGAKWAMSKLSGSSWVRMAGAGGGLLLREYGDSRELILLLGRRAPERDALPAAVADWAYVKSLLALEPELYDAERWTLKRGEGRDAVVRKMARSRDPEAALRFFRRYRPVGTCSMDTHPADAAAAYADLCHRLGRLGCFLRLQVRIMGNQFDRVTWGSYAEPAHKTRADRLGRAGVDVDRFLRGLVIELSTPRPERIGPYRLARAIREAGRADALRPVLIRWAEHPRLDEFNRLRAVQVLAFLDQEPPPARWAVPEELYDLKLAPSARRWLDLTAEELTSSARR